MSGHTPLPRWTVFLLPVPVFSGALAFRPLKRGLGSSWLGKQSGQVLPSVFDLFPFKTHFQGGQIIKKITK